MYIKQVTELMQAQKMLVKSAAFIYAYYTGRASYLADYWSFCGTIFPTWEQSYQPNHVTVHKQDVNKIQLRPSDNTHT